MSISTTIEIDTVETFKDTYDECHWCVEKINLYNNLAECYFCSDQNQVNDNVSIIFSPFKQDQENEDHNIEICLQCFYFIDQRVFNAVKEFICYIESMVISGNLTVDHRDQPFYELFNQYLSWSSYFYSINKGNTLFKSRKKKNNPRDKSVLKEDVININFKILNIIYVERHFIQENFNLKTCICGRVYCNLFDDRCQQCFYYMGETETPLPPSTASKRKKGGVNGGLPPIIKGLPTHSRFM